MEKFRINPINYKADYIANLNKCFGNWGGEEEYKWGLERKVGPNFTDVLLIENEEDGVIAGSAVSYRTLSRDNISIDIGIMTGSWTLPAARRKGCFTKMIHCSKDLCQEKNVPFLTAFVTETNASSRRLESEGSYMFPTYHLFSPENDVPGEGVSLPQEVEQNEEVEEKIFDRFQQTQKGLLNFSYSFREFRSQYLNRVKKSYILRYGNEYAVLEDGNNEVKVLLLTHENLDIFKDFQQAISKWCHKNRGRRSFFFTTRKELANISEELGFENLPGYFTILSTGDENINYREKFRNLNINMADKM